MRSGQFDGLASLRERHFGFTVDFVARRARLSSARLHEIEGGAPLSVFEAETLAEVYGLDDADILVERPIKLSMADALTLLPDHAEFKELSQDGRARVLHVSRAAQDVASLRRLLGEPDPILTLRGRTPKRQPAAPGATPFAVGKERAVEIRRALGLGTGPIRSVRDLVTTHFPEVAVLHANLGKEPVAGLAFVDAVRGPAIVLNTHGENESPLVRRFSLAHELSHLVFDWKQGEPFAELSGFQGDRQLEREQRANAFAMRLLCPETQVRKIARDHGHDPMRAAAILVKDWGIHFEAARLHLRNTANLEVPREPASFVQAAWPRWTEGEAVPTGFPLAATPLERQTDVARLAASAYSKGLISRDRFARLLGTTPADEVERVLDLFSLDAPTE